MLGTQQVLHSPKRAVIWFMYLHLLILRYVIRCLAEVQTHCFQSGHDLPEQQPVRREAGLVCWVRGGPSVTSSVPASLGHLPLTKKPRQNRAWGLCQVPRLWLFQLWGFVSIQHSVPVPPECSLVGIWGPLHLSSRHHARQVSHFPCPSFFSASEPPFKPLFPSLNNPISRQYFPLFA